MAEWLEREIRTIWGNALVDMLLPWQLVFFGLPDLEALMTIEHRVEE